MNVVYVEWLDSAMHRGWDEADRSGPALIKSVGILVHRDEGCIVLSTSRGGNSGKYIDQLSIPMGAVKKVRRVKLWTT